MLGEDESEVTVDSWREVFVGRGENVEGWGEEGGLWFGPGDGSWFGPDVDLALDG